MPEQLPTPAPSREPRPGWRAIVGRGTGRDAIVAVIYPAQPSPTPPAPEAA